MLTHANRMQHDLDRLFGQGSPRDPQQSFLTPACNVWEDDSHVYVEAELPGYAAEDIQLQLTADGQLEIAAEKRPPELPGARCVMQERRYGSYRRTLKLATGKFDEDGMSAKFEHGLLTVTLPRRAADQPRRIEIKTD